MKVLFYFVFLLLAAVAFNQAPPTSIPIPPPPPKKPKVYFPIEHMLYTKNFELKDANINVIRHRSYFHYNTYNYLSYRINDSTIYLSQFEKLETIGKTNIYCNPSNLRTIIHFNHIYTYHQSAGYHTPITEAQNNSLISFKSLKETSGQDLEKNTPANSKSFQPKAKNCSTKGSFYYDKDGARIFIVKRNPFYKGKPSNELIDYTQITIKNFNTDEGHDMSGLILDYLFVESPWAVH